MPSMPRRSRTRTSHKASDAWPGPNWNKNLRNPLSFNGVAAGLNKGHYLLNGLALWTLAVLLGSVVVR